MGIANSYTSVAHPQANGLAEVTNRTILGGLKKRLGEYEGSWVDELPSVLWSYRTTPRTATGETPFNLCFGVNAVLPLEVGLLSDRVKLYDEQTNDTKLREDLDLLPELRDRAAVLMANYQQRISRYYNKKVRPREYLPGDLVLRKAAISDPKARVGKLTHNWKGPYRVTEKLRSGGYRLEEVPGKPIPRMWNSNDLKRYYP